MATIAEYLAGVALRSVKDVGANSFSLATLSTSSFSRLVYDGMSTAVGPDEGS